MTELKKYELEKNVYYQTMIFRADACMGAAKIITDNEILDDLIVRMDIDLVSDNVLWKAARDAATARIKDYAFTEYVSRYDYNVLLKMINGEY